MKAKKPSENYDLFIDILKDNINKVIENVYFGYLN